MMEKTEAIKHLQAAKLMLMGKDNQPVSDLYYAIDEAVDALDKQVPKRPKGMHLVKDCMDLFIGYCPSCEEGSNSEINYCMNCGQKLDWKR